jgi:hypothetical protein
MILWQSQGALMACDAHSCHLLEPLRGQLYDVFEDYDGHNKGLNQLVASLPLVSPGVVHADRGRE